MGERVRIRKGVRPHDKKKTTGVCEFLPKGGRGGEGERGGVDNKRGKGVGRRSKRNFRREKRKLYRRRKKEAESGSEKEKGRLGRG